MRRRGRDLDRMVEAVLAGDPLPSGRLEPDEEEALRAAIDLRAARPGADLPEEEVLTDLRRRLAATAASGEADASRRGLPRRALRDARGGRPGKIGRAHLRTPVTLESRLPS